MAYMGILLGCFNTGRTLEYINMAIQDDHSLFEEDGIYINLIRAGKFLDKSGINDDIKRYIGRLKQSMEKYKDIEYAVLKEPEKTNCLNAIHSLRSLIESELSKVLIFNAVEECSLDRDCLIKLSKQENSVFFEEDVWSKISELAKSDFSDAAKCILMGASTPAAMISLRAAEDIIRHYYIIKTDEEPGKKTWGTLITELKRVPDIRTELIEHLDYIRKTRRNLAQHPDKIYSQREAERIFMDVLSMVHDIYEDIE